MLIEVNDTLARGLIASGLAKEVQAPAVEPVLSWPRVLTVPTPWGIPVRVNAAAPINPQWYPGMMASIVGQSGTLDEPSNGGKIGQPIRSAAGFPLAYALDGQGGYIDSPSVCVGDQTFNSDAAALDWLARSAAPQSGGVRTGAPTPHDDAHGSLDPSVIAEWQALPANDRDRGTWLNRKGTEVARLLLNNGYMSHADSARYDLAAGGYTQ